MTGEFVEAGHSLEFLKYANAMVLACETSIQRHIKRSLTLTIHVLFE